MCAAQLVAAHLVFRFAGFAAKALALLCAALPARRPARAPPLVDAPSSARRRRHSPSDLGPAWAVAWRERWVLLCK